MHLQNISEVLKSSGFGVTIYLVITREAYQVFYGLIILVQGLFYSLLSLLHQKGNKTEDGNHIAYNIVAILYIYNGLRILPF